MSGFMVGTRVKKLGGDYGFEGFVVANFKKRTGQRRYVVENEQGLLFIFSETQLQIVSTLVLPLESITDLEPHLSDEERALVSADTFHIWKKVVEARLGRER